MKYRTFHITRKWLVDYHACDNGIAFFSKHFPKGLTISNNQDEMNELVASICLHSYDVYWRSFANWLTGGYLYEVSKYDDDDINVLGAVLSDCSILKNGTRCG